jgi:hypothetical protein
MWLYTIINTIISGIITIPIYIGQKVNYYKEIDELKEQVEVLIKEITSLHKHRMEMEDNITNIVSTMRFTGVEWQNKIISKKFDKVISHHYESKDDIIDPVIVEYLNHDNK